MDPTEDYDDPCDEYDGARAPRYQPRSCRDCGGTQRHTDGCDNGRCPNARPHPEPPFHEPADWW